MVDEIRIGEEGYALLVAPDGTLLAHGNPDRKALVAQSRQGRGPRPPAVGTERAAVRRRTAARCWRSKRRCPLLNWTLIVEQPTSEAFAAATRLQRQLLVAIGAGLLVMLGVGLFFGRRFIAPIFQLQRATHGVASGDLETRVHIDTGDEFGDLGQAFNTMADRLISCRKTSRSRSGRRHSGVWPPASSTTCRIPFRTSATARGCCCATTSIRSRDRRSTAPSNASCRRSGASWTTCGTS